MKNFREAGALPWRGPCLGGALALAWAFARPSLGPCVGVA